MGHFFWGTLYTYTHIYTYTGGCYGVTSITAFSYTHIYEYIHLYTYTQKHHQSFDHRRRKSASKSLSKCIFLRTCLNFDLCPSCVFQLVVSYWINPEKSNISGGPQNIQRLQWSKYISNLMCLLLSSLHSSTILCCILQNPKTNVPVFSFCALCKINVLVHFIWRAIVLSKSSIISDWATVNTAFSFQLINDDHMNNILTFSSQIFFLKTEAPCVGKPMLLSLWDINAFFGGTVCESSKCKTFWWFSFHLLFSTWWSTP